MNEVTHTPFDFFLPFDRIMTYVFAVIRIRGTSTRWSDWVWTWIWIGSKSKTIERNDHSLLPKKNGGWKSSVSLKVWHMPLTAQRLTVRFQTVPRWSLLWSTLKTEGDFRICKELIHLGCYPAGHCQKMGVCSAVLSTYQTKTKTTTKAVCPDPDTGMSHGRHPTSKHAASTANSR